MTKRKLKPWEYDTNETFDQFRARYFKHPKQYMEHDEINNAIYAALSGDIEDIKYRLENGLADAWKISIRKADKLLSADPFAIAFRSYIDRRAWAAAKPAENGYGYYWPWLDKNDHEAGAAVHYPEDDAEYYYFELARTLLENFEKANGGWDAANCKVADAKSDYDFYDGHGVFHYNEDEAWIVFDDPAHGHFKYQVESSDHLWVRG